MVIENLADDDEEIVRLKKTFLFFKPQAGLLLNPLHSTANKLLVSLSHILSISHILSMFPHAAIFCHQDISLTQIIRPSQYSA